MITRGIAHRAFFYKLRKKFVTIFIVADSMINDESTHISFGFVHSVLYTGYARGVKLLPFE